MAEARAAADGMLVLQLLGRRAEVSLGAATLRLRRPTRALAVLDATGLFAQLLAGLATCVLVEVLVERGAIYEAERALAPFVSDLQRSSLSAATLRYVRGRTSYSLSVVSVRPSATIVR